MHFILYSVAGWIFYGSWLRLDQATPVGLQEKSEPVDANDTAAPESQLDSQVRMASFAMDAKSNVIFSNLRSSYLFSNIYIYIFISNKNSLKEKCKGMQPYYTDVSKG